MKVDEPDKFIPKGLTDGICGECKEYKAANEKQIRSN